MPSLNYFRLHFPLPNTCLPRGKSPSLGISTLSWFFICGMHVLHFNLIIHHQTCVSFSRITYNLLSRDRINNWLFSCLVTSSSHLILAKASILDLVCLLLLFRRHCFSWAFCFSLSLFSLISKASRQLAIFIDLRFTC